MPNIEDVENRIRRYESTYQDKLKGQLPQYASIPDAFPYFLKGANHILAVLGQDGVVVIRKDADQDSFEFSHELGSTVGDILQEQGIGELTKPEEEEPAAFRMAGPQWVMNTGEMCGYGSCRIMGDTQWLAEPLSRRYAPA